MAWFILIVFVVGVLFFAWVLCRAAAMADEDNERAFQAWLLRKDVKHREGT